MDCSRRGTVSELEACQWLIEQGFEVFRNVCPRGPVDIVALDPKTGKTHLIDVKTATAWRNKDGTVREEAYSARRAKPAQEALGVELIAVSPITGECSWAR